MAGDKGISWFN